MENKYERALENVRAEWGTSDCDIDILEELVERATPKKPNQTVFNAFCPNCGEALGRQFAIDGINGSRFRQYCPTCGQALDWELEEVKE